MPYFLGGNYTSTLIEKHGMNLDEFLEEKAKHINHLKIRSRIRSPRGAGEIIATAFYTKIPKIRS